MFCMERRGVVRGMESIYGEKRCSKRDGKYAKSCLLIHKFSTFVELTRIILGAIEDATLWLIRNTYDHIT